MNCEDISAVLPGAVDDDLSTEAQTHVETCLACQADVARYKRVSRQIRTLADVYASPPAGLLDDVMAAIGEDQLRRARRRKRVAAGIGIGGIAVAAAAAGTVAGIVAHHRHKHVQLAG